MQLLFMCSKFNLKLLNLIKSFSNFYVFDKLIWVKQTKCRSSGGPLNRRNKRKKISTQPEYTLNHKCYPLRVKKQQKIANSTVISIENLIHVWNFI